MRQTRFTHLKKFAPIALLATAFIVGCDESADRRVSKTIEESRLARLKEGGGEEAQSLLNKAAGESEASAATKAHVKSLLGNAQMDAASDRINDISVDDKGLANGVDVGNREIARLLWEISQQGQHIAMSNALVGAYAQFEPKEVKAAAAAESAAATGTADKPNWVGENAVAIPTITAANQKVAALQDQIAAQQKTIDGLTQQRNQLATQGSDLARQSETEKGDTSVATFTKASALRKQAADTQNQMDGENNKLARLQADLALAQTQATAVAAAKDQFDKFAAQQEEGWVPIRAQMMTQRDQSTATLVGKGDSSIAAKSAKLAAQMQKTNKAYAEAEENLNNAIKSFQDAARSAGELANNMRTSMANLTDPALKAAIDQLLKVYNQNVFKLSEGNATLTLAHLQAARVQALAEQQHLVDQLTATLKAAALSVPKELDDPKLADAIKMTAKSAQDNFGAADQLYQDVSEGAGTPEVDRTAGSVGRVYVSYGSALVSRAMGDKNGAATKLTEAKSRRDAITQEGKGGAMGAPRRIGGPRRTNNRPRARSCPQHLEQHPQQHQQRPQQEPPQRPPRRSKKKTRSHRVKSVPIAATLRVAE